MSLAMSERVESIIEQLTTEELTHLVAGRDMWHANGVDRLGIRGLKVTDGPNGARGAFFVGTTSACLPCGTALGATWNTALIRELGGLLAEEARSKGADLLLAPTVNIHRHPLAGRNFECYSEDPLLSARAAVAYIEGVQAGGVGATVKHLVANDSEFERHTISSEVPERALREIYLPPFEAAVMEARTMSLMTAYNRLAGDYCGESALLMSILHDEWGFDGFVISDWWAIHDTVTAGNHGVDLEMPGPAVHFGEALTAAIESGTVERSAVEGKARRLLAVMERLGVLDSPEHTDDASVDRPEHRELLRRAARGAVVLLTNREVDGAPALPLDGSKLARLAVIGPNADVAIVQGGGSAAVTPHHTITVLDGLRARFGDEVDIVHEAGVDAFRNLPALDSRWVRPTASNSEAASGFTLEYFTGLELDGEPFHVADQSAARLNWLGDPLPGLIGGHFSARLSGRFTAPSDGDFTFGLVVGGKGRVLIDGEVVADMWNEWRPGTAFFGLGSEEIRHTRTFRRGEECDVVAEMACIEGLAAAALLLGGLAEVGDDGIERAVAAAAEADAAIVVVGLNQDWETEGEDRSSFALPGRQDELVAAVAAANPRTIVLVNAGSPVAMDWADDVAAVAQIWYLGQESGDAVAELISGDYSPSGRLPTTYPVRLEDCPAFGSYPGADGKVVYEEGLYVGYRHWDSSDAQPRFPFGYGLSYSRFEVADVAVEAGADSAVVSAQITNLGDVVAAEVVQVYVSPTSAPVERPLQELKGWARVELEPGAGSRIEVRLDRRAFSYWDDQAHDWRCEPGEFVIHVSHSSAERWASVPITITG